MSELVSEWVSAGHVDGTYGYVLICPVTTNSHHVSMRSYMIDD